MGESARVVVAGGTAVGLLFRVERPPRPGETVVARSMVYIDGGKGAGQAIGVARLGADCALISAVGDDALGTRLLNLLDRERVDATGVAVIPDTGSMLGMVVIDDDGENQIVVALNAMSAMEVSHIEEDLIAGARCCLVSLEIPFDVARQTLALARDHGVTTVLNPAPAPTPEEAASLAPLADFITPNETEARSMVGADGDDEAIARRLIELGAGAVAMTLGAEGALLVDGDGITSIPTPFVRAEDIVDTAGAGDAFNAAFVVALANGRTAAEAAAFGCDAGSRIVQGPGFVEALHTWEGLALE